MPAPADSTYAGAGNEQIVAAPAPDLTRLEPIGDMLSLLADDAAPLPERANAYVSGRRLKLALERALRPVTAHLQDVLVRLQADTDSAGAARHKPFRAGPLRLSWKAIEPKWVANSPEHWTDPVVQDALEELSLTPGMKQYVAYLPGHYEILPQAIGLAMTEGDPVAHKLFEQATIKGWRTVAGRSASIEVD